jgi:hypothetical protein
MVNRDVPDKKKTKVIPAILHVVDDGLGTGKRRSHRVLVVDKLRINGKAPGVLDVEVEVKLVVMDVKDNSFVSNG